MSGNQWFSEVFRGYGNETQSQNVLIKKIYYPPNVNLFKIINKNLRKKCKICLKLTIKTPKRCL